MGFPLEEMNLAANDPFLAAQVGSMELTLTGVITGLDGAGIIGQGIVATLGS